MIDRGDKAFERPAVQQAGHLHFCRGSSLANRVFEGGRFANRSLDTRRAMTLHALTLELICLS